MNNSTKKLITKSSLAIGIDVGGTKVSLGLVNREGKILKEFRQPFERKDIDDFLNNLVEQISNIKAYANGFPIEGIGIGFKGLVDYAKQKIVMSSIFPDASDLNICEILEKKFRLPTAIDNDVKAAALAEAKLGVGQSLKHFVYINIGTGIGIGIIDEGKLIRGRNNFSGEFGKTFFQTFEKDHNFTFLESVASGRGLENETRRLSTNYLLHNTSVEWVEGQDVFSSEIVRQYKNGDPLAQNIIERALHFLSIGIINLEMILNAQYYVFGGGVVDQWFIELLKQKILYNCDKAGLVWNAELSISKLGSNKIGLIGAAFVLFDKNTYGVNEQ